MQEDRQDLKEVPETPMPMMKALRKISTAPIGRVTVLGIRSCCHLESLRRQTRGNRGNEASRQGTKPRYYGPLRVSWRISQNCRK